MRNYYTFDELEAAHILDLAKFGGEVSSETIAWALWILGDLVGTA